MTTRQKISTCLWFDGQAEAAATHYTAIFKNSKLLNVVRYGDAGPGPKGSVMTVEFELEGRHFLGLNGGPQFKFNEAISLQVYCDTQGEIDELWSKLGAGGEPGPCGWLKDKFGLSWQVTPSVLPELVRDSDAAASQRVMSAMMQMKKLDIAALQAAHRGR